MDRTQLGLWIGFGILNSGSALLWQQSVGMAVQGRDGVPPQKLLHCTLSITLYLSMVTSQTVDIVNDQEVIWGRYIDWSVLTLNLGVLARGRPKLIAGIVGADVFSFPQILISK